MTNRSPSTHVAFIKSNHMKVICGRWPPTRRKLSNGFRMKTRTDLRRWASPFLQHRAATAMNSSNIPCKMPRLLSARGSYPNKKQNDRLRRRLCACLIAGSPPEKKEKNQKNAKTFISDCDRHVLRRVFGVIVTVFTAYLEVDRRTIGTQLALVNEGNAKCLKNKIKFTFKMQK